MNRMNPIRRDLQHILDARDDIGVTRIIFGWLLEPRPLFDPGRRRRPKAGVVIVGSYLLLLAVACAVFNLGWRP